MNIKRIFPIFIILLSFGIAIFYYPQMPPQIASHWNASGVVDGYMSKFWGLFFLPILLFFLYLLFIFLPMIDPKKENVKDFRNNFDNFINAFFVFMFGIYLFTIAWNLGYKIDIMKFFAIGFAVFIYFLAILIEKAKMNWFIGIRTPWTLSNEKVWDDTHRLGGKAYKIAAALSLLGLFTGKYALAFIALPLVLVSFYLVIYSYLEYKKEKNKGK
ncbi:MAG: DUF1648 domain-containing protein [Candidatus Berkelbacteria bacterium]